MKKTTSTFMKMKQELEKITMMTAYDAPTAHLVEEAEIDMILVGDSLGMVVLGYDSTIPVTVNDMLHHTKAVKRGATQTFIVTDMPYLSYHGEFQQTLELARTIMQEGGCNALKLEGAGEIVETVRKLTNAGIPIVGHLGLTPQSVGVLGGYRVQGKSALEAEKLIDDAKRLEEAGAFAIVVECVPEEVGKALANSCQIPIIGIGAGAETDGQVLVYHDLVGYGYGHVPKFVKQYTNIASPINKALVHYRKEVKAGQFPNKLQSFSMTEDQVQALYGGSNESSKDD
ncbi:3-methyl-2-oxobutanoate hydroxymethyltransferase [Halalkalibacter hemicellulosilyticus]|uniref:3-methyl-2-oxobutanoate hydroxymethyltransferase n=1 Tax=Halalkalibacter hemicellulosilyticusJCM 9152 TaxID=1236971 RepID=W4QBJ8_9BACI|nr:3-methyl-2-oxobutanoate hydroxymethyltransferase [Halalkalibacter hemicellulosilyticus]GAE29048.1 3-methyl-2-oxobutanoate hydroxymethyltransferase [Halalkalibacter hemicellulosilyticusJCM 9152]